MLLKCRTKRPSDLGQFRRGLFYTAETEYGDLQVGGTYPVYGMALFSNADLAAGVDPPPDWFPAQPGLIVLLGLEYHHPPTVRPEWFPIDLFSLEDSHIPDNWEFSTSYEFGSEKNTSNTVARWGYPELVRSDLHFDGLAERNPQDLAIFRAEVERRGQQ